MVKYLGYVTKCVLVINLNSRESKYDIPEYNASKNFLEKFFGIHQNIHTKSRLKGISMSHAEYTRLYQKYAIKINRKYKKSVIRKRVDLSKRS